MEVCKTHWQDQVTHMEMHKTHRHGLKYAMSARTKSHKHTMFAVRLNAVRCHLSKATDCGFRSNQATNTHTETRLQTMATKPREANRPLTQPATFSHHRTNAPCLHIENLVWKFRVTKCMYVVNLLGMML